MFDRDKWKILRGDKVMIITGKDKGEVGIVSKVIRDKRVPKVIVEGRNLVSAVCHFVDCIGHIRDPTGALKRNVSRTPQIW